MFSWQSYPGLRTSVSRISLIPPEENAGWDLGVMTHWRDYKCVMFPSKCFSFFLFPPYLLISFVTQKQGLVLPSCQLSQYCRRQKQLQGLLKERQENPAGRIAFFFFFFFKGMPINAQTQLAFISPTLKRIKEKILQFNGQPLVLYVCLSTLWVESRNF